MTKILYIKLAFTNLFLLKCKRGYLLIDTGFPKEYNSFVEKLKKLNIKPSEIKYLLLTHHHDDHAGFAAELIKNTKARIIAHKKAVQILETGKIPMKNGNFLNWRVKMAIGIHSKFSSRSWSFSPLKFTKKDYIIEGDDFKLLKKIGINGEILYTPGHTEDSISVLLSDGSAIVGDVAMNAFYFKILGNKYRPIWLQDIKEVYKSWGKLIKHRAKTIYASHGKPFSVKKLATPKKFK